MGELVNLEGSKETVNENRTTVKVYIVSYSVPSGVLFTINSVADFYFFDKNKAREKAWGMLCKSPGCTVSLKIVDVES